MRIFTLSSYSITRILYLASVLQIMFWLSSCGVRRGLPEYQGPSPQPLSSAAFQEEYQKELNACLLLIMCGRLSSTKAIERFQYDDL